MNPLQSGDGLGDTLWHIKAFGCADFGIDQPLLKVSQGCTELLLQQALLILTLPGCTKTQAVLGKREFCVAGEINEDRQLQPEESVHVLIKTKRMRVQMLRYCKCCLHMMRKEKETLGTRVRSGQVEKWQSG